MSKALVYGDSINTDLVIAGKYTKTLNFQDLADHCMEDLDPRFREKVRPGDVLVAGCNFGCGSSREQAPLALKYSGMRSSTPPSTSTPPSSAASRACSSARSMSASA